MNISSKNSVRKKKKIEKKSDAVFWGGAINGPSGL